MDSLPAGALSISGNYYHFAYEVEPKALICNKDVDFMNLNFDLKIGTPNTNGIDIEE